MVTNVTTFVHLACVRLYTEHFTCIFNLIHHNYPIVKYFPDIFNLTDSVTVYFIYEETEAQRNCLNAYRGVISDRLAAPRRTCTIGL